MEIYGSSLWDNLDLVIFGGVCKLACTNLHVHLRLDNI